jgi:hypothetical protein
MVVVKDKSYLITTRIEVGHHFNREKGEAYLVLREPNNSDLFRFKNASHGAEREAIKRDIEAAEVARDGVNARRLLVELSKLEQLAETEMLAVFSDILPHVLVEHNIHKPAGSAEVLMSSEEVRDLVVDRLEIYVEVVAKYCEEVIFTLGSRNAPRSDGSPDSSTETK